MFGRAFVDLLTWRAAEVAEQRRAAYMAGYVQLGQWLASLFEGWAL